MPRLRTASFRFWRLLAATFHGLWLFAGILLAGPPQPAAHVTVQLYNWARVASQTLTAAESEAVRIFRASSDVDVLWLNCPVSVSESRVNKVCMEPCPQSRIALRIISQVPARHKKPSLGAALSENGIYATIFYPRVEEYAQERIATSCEILGHAMAHEIGHLLLGAGSHARFGIMRRRWSPRDLRQMTMGGLLFNPWEGDRIRDAATRRIAARDLRLTLVIYDYAHVGGETLTNAENTASEIFARAGIQLIWREGFAYVAERQKAEIPQPEDPATLVVKLQPASHAARYRVRSTCEGIGLRSDAIVFVRSSDRRDAASIATHLGCVMAHELGHILLGPNAHSIVGIMRATLLPQDWQKAAQGTLDFTRSQNRQIQTWIAQRSHPGDAGAVE